MDKHTEVFAVYADATRQLLAENPSALQVTLLVTDCFRMFSYPTADFADASAEDECLRRMTETLNTRVILTVTLWRNGQLDVPSYAFREKLTALHPDNRDCCILLQTEDGLTVKRLSMTMSSPAE